MIFLGPDQAPGQFLVYFQSTIHLYPHSLSLSRERERESAHFSHARENIIFKTTLKMSNQYFVYAQQDGKVACSGPFDGPEQAQSAMDLGKGAQSMILISNRKVVE